MEVITIETEMTARADDVVILEIPDLVPPEPPRVSAERRAANIDRFRV